MPHASLSPGTSASEVPGPSGDNAPAGAGAFIFTWREVLSGSVGTALGGSGSGDPVDRIHEGHATARPPSRSAMKAHGRGKLSPQRLNRRTHVSLTLDADRDAELELLRELARGFLQKEY